MSLTVDLVAACLPAAAKLMVDLLTEGEDWAQSSNHLTRSSLYTGDNSCSSPLFPLPLVCVVRSGYYPNSIYLAFCNQGSVQQSVFCKHTKKVCASCLDSVTGTSARSTNLTMSMFLCSSVNKGRGKVEGQ